jgi:hypothetical protein
MDILTKQGIHKLLNNETNIKIQISSVVVVFESSNFANAKKFK